MQASGEKRELRRARTLKRGVVAFSGRHATVECSVRNISTTGCQISSDAHQLIPDTFELLIELDGLWYPCKVAWRKPPLIGVVFTGPTQPAKVTRTQVVLASAPARFRLRRPPATGA